MVNQGRYGTGGGVGGHGGGGHGNNHLHSSSHMVDRDSRPMQVPSPVINVPVRSKLPSSSTAVAQQQQQLGTSYHHHHSHHMHHTTTNITPSHLMSSHHLHHTPLRNPANLTPSRLRSDGRDARDPYNDTSGRGGVTMLTGSASPRVTVSHSNLRGGGAVLPGDTRDGPSGLSGGGGGAVGVSVGMGTVTNNINKNNNNNSNSNINIIDSPTTPQMPYELECDYDTSATVLYELLESSSWEKARSRCRTHPDEIRTWIIRKDKNGQVRWKLLPLHAAIIFQSPSFVVQALLERYPAAASRKDDQGMLPLHLAFRHKQDDEELLELLLLQYPKAVVLRDRRERVPLEHGRDSRYSAKLLRLYAEATVLANRTPGGALTPSPIGLTNSRGDTITTESLTQTAHTSHNNTHPTAAKLKQIEAEHEAKLAVVRADYDYQIKTMKGQYEDRLQALQDDTNAMVRQAEATAEEQRQIMISQHKEEIGELRDILARQVSQDRSVTEALQKEVHVLQESLQEARNDAEVIAEQYSSLLRDNDSVRDFLQQICQEQGAIQEIAAKQQEYIKASRTLRMDLVQTLLKQEEKDSENDRLRGSKMVEISNHIQGRINDFVEIHGNSNNHSINNNNKTSNNNKKSSEQQQQHHSHPNIQRSNTYISAEKQSPEIVRTHSVDNIIHTMSNTSVNNKNNNINKTNSKINSNNVKQQSPTRHRSPTPDILLTHSLDKRGVVSRIEVERGQGAAGTGMIYSDKDGQTEVFFNEEAINVVSPTNNNSINNNVNNHHNSNTNTSNINNNNNNNSLVADPEEYAEVKEQLGHQVGVRAGDTFGEVRILGDDISAITENSAY